jgi:hypothetical protein
MFSAFSDVWRVVKPKSTENSRKLTGKSQRKIRKMVYGKFFRKPFSKTRVRLPLESRLSLCSLSFSLCFLLFTVPSHRATPSTPSHLAFSLAQLIPSQPRATSLSLSPISLLAPKPPSHQSHRHTEATVALKPQQRPVEHPSHRSLSNGLDLDLIRSDLDLISLFLFSFSFNIWDLLIFFW